MTHCLSPCHHLRHQTYISLVFENLKRNNQKDFVFVTYKKSTNLDYMLLKRRR
jgi:hypothetical protein